MYRVRITNAGKRDLFEVYMIAKIKVKTPDRKTHTTYFTVGEENIIPIIAKKLNKKKRNKHKTFYKRTGKWRKNIIYSYGIYANEMTYSEFSKNFYDESIIEEAKNKTLVIDDIFQTYSDVSLTIFLFGNDSITGARRKYESEVYTHKDIEEGKFHRFSGIPWPKGHIYINRKNEVKLLKKEMNKIDNPQKVLEQFLSFSIASSKEIFNLFSKEKEMITYNKGAKKGVAYLKGSREDRVLLVSHADDRAGCAMLYLLLDSGHSVLILDREEHSQADAHYLKEFYPDIFTELNKHQYFIQLDRKKVKDYKCYNIPVSKEFRRFIEKEFSYKSAGMITRTDVAVLCDKICGVNLSIGYHHEHTPHEKLCYNEWLHTYEILASMLVKKQERYLLGQKSPKNKL